MKNSIKYFYSVIFLFFACKLFAQGSIPEPMIIMNNSVIAMGVKSSVKLNEQLFIKDTIKKIEAIDITITSKPIETSFLPSQILPAKMVNEPLSKLYHCLVKLGMGNYKTPYAEIFINNLRNKENVYGFRFKHLSSASTLEKTGFAGFSDDEIYLNGKHFFKKHTLTGDLNYLRNLNHFYGYNTDNNTLTSGFTEQVYNTFEGKINLVSHFTDTTKLNHDINLNFYNQEGKNNLNETYVGATGLVKTYLAGERFNVLTTADFYIHKMDADTVTNLILKLNPFFESFGKKWSADIHYNFIVDKFSDSTVKFKPYFFKINFSYNVYNNIVIPYAGINGDIQKNSFRSLMLVNPFLQTNIQYKNSYFYEGFIGLRGALSSKINYDSKVTYQKVENLALYSIDYSYLYKNRFNVIYDDASVLKVNGQLKYSYKEKVSVIAQGNYYNYKMKVEKYAWHRPSFDITLSSNYNIKSKIIIKAAMFFIGNQWVLQKNIDAMGTEVSIAKNLKGMADINIGAEYRYTKFLSVYANFNNVANFRYYRWDNYPSQRFNFMFGVTFIPF
jgi:hypothetical protein